MSIVETLKPVQQMKKMGSYSTNSLFPLKKNAKLIALLAIRYYFFEVGTFGWVILVQVVLK